MGRLLCVCVCRTGVERGGQNGGYKVVLMCSSKHWQAADQLKPTHTDTHSYRRPQTVLGAQTAAKVWKVLLALSLHSVLFTALSYFQTSEFNCLDLIFLALFSISVLVFECAGKKPAYFTDCCFLGGFNAERGSRTLTHGHVSHIQIKKADRRVACSQLRW